MAQGYPENEKVYMLELDEDEINYLQRAVEAYNDDQVEEDIAGELIAAITDALNEDE